MPVDSRVRAASKDSCQTIANYIRHNPGCVPYQITRALNLTHGQISGLLISLTYRYPWLFESDDGRLYLGKRYWIEFSKEEHDG